MTNILLISTVNHNPGDEFIRFGQQHLLKKVVADAEFTVVHKHDPRTLFADFNGGRRPPHRLVAAALNRLRRRAGPGSDLLVQADMVVFAGTPFIWRQNTRILPSTSANAEWIGPTWRRLLSELPDTPVLNLAAGTSLSAGQTPDDILADEAVVQFLNDSVQRSALTTARDRFTAAILRSLGHDVQVLPCTSMWAAAGAHLRVRDPEYVAVNVMRHGVHTGRGKSGASDWRHVITEVVEWLSQRHAVRFVCHSAEERSLARSWFPRHDAFFSPDSVEVLDAYGRAFYAVANRVHGAAGAASFGIPAIGLGGDSRMQLLSEFGLPVLDAAEASARTITEACSELESRYSGHVERLKQIKSSAESTYLDLLQRACARAEP